MCNLWPILVAAAVAQPGDWSVAPRLERGLELVYRGTYSEQLVEDEQQFSKAYDLDTRIFALDVTPQGANVAVMTVLRTPGSANDAPKSVRLELGVVDRNGGFVWQTGGAFAPSLVGPATLEGGLFVVLPGPRVTAGQEWDVNASPRPPFAWRAIDSESVARVRCARLAGVQQTADGSPAWKRTDTAWLALTTGLVQRLERQFEWHELDDRSGRTTVTSRTTYELVSKMHYPDGLAAERRREIERACELGRKLRELDASGSVANAAAYERLLPMIEQQLRQPVTPYRPAVQWLRQQADARRLGEAPATYAPEESAPPPPIAVGQPAPDFLAADPATGATTRLARLRGRPVLLVFYSPSSASAAETLRCVQSMHQRFGESAAVAVVSVPDDTSAASRQRAAYCPDVPILAGRGVAGPFTRDASGRETTPRFIVLDASGVVRHIADGWGSETAGLVERAIK
jgi:peroxiredoxin